MLTYHIDILGKGKHLPQVKVPSAAMDERLGLPHGTCQKKSGVTTRYFTEGETVSQMGAKAAQLALTEAGLSLEDMDALVYTGATPEQPIPCNAVFIQKELGGASSGVACFDIDATCLSFVVGLDLMSASLAVGRYRRVLLVSSEIASGHINYKHIESASLFGDGAVAYVLAQGSPDGGSRILSCHMESYGSESEYCRLVGGGSKLSPHQYTAARHDEYCFSMDGRKIFKSSAKFLPAFFAKALAKAQLEFDDIDLFIPHQASQSAMALMRKRLKIPESKWMEIIATHGNQISASIPTALYEALVQNRAKKGDKIMLIGTGAGLGLAAIILEY